MHHKAEAAPGMHVLPPMRQAATYMRQAAMGMHTSPPALPRLTWCRTRRAACLCASPRCRSSSCTYARTCPGGRQEGSGRAGAGEG